MHLNIYSTQEFYKTHHWVLVLLLSETCLPKYLQLFEGKRTSSFAPNMLWGLGSNTKYVLKSPDVEESHLGIDSKGHQD